MALQVCIIHKYCTCTDEFYNPTELGKFQHKYEDLRREGISVYDTLQKMKIVRMCCRESIFNPPSHFLNSENVGKIMDDTGHLASPDLVRSRKFRDKETVLDTEPILPSKPFPELP